MNKIIAQIFIVCLCISALCCPIYASVKSCKTPYIQNITPDGTQTIIYANSKFYFTKEGFIYTHEYSRQTIRDLTKLLKLKDITEFKLLPPNSYGSIPQNLQSYTKYILNKNDIQVVAIDSFTPPNSVNYHYHLAQQQLNQPKVNYKRTFIKYPHRKPAIPEKYKIQSTEEISQIKSENRTENDNKLD